MRSTIEFRIEDNAEIFEICANLLPQQRPVLAGPGRRGAYQGAWTLVSSLSMGSALALSGVVSGALGWEGAWLGCAALTALAASALSVSRQRFVG